MEVTYQKDIEHNYLVLQLPDQVQGSEYQIRMLQGNVIPGILPCKLRSIDGKYFIYYEITSRQQLSGVLAHHPAGSSQIWSVSRGLGKALESVGRYLLGEEGLLLDPDLIYVDSQTKETSFCYLPFGEENLPDTFRKLTEYLLMHLDHKEEQAVILAYQLYSGTMVENYSVGAVVRDLQQKPMRAEHEEKEKREEPKKEQREEGREVRVWREPEPEPVEGKGKKLSKRVKVPIKPTGQEYLQKKRKRRKIALCLVAAMAILAAVAGLVLVGILSLTQAGGILFLGAGVSFYVFSGKDDRKKKQEERKQEKQEKKREKKQEKEQKKQEEMISEKEQQEEIFTFLEDGADSEEEGHTMLLCESRQKPLPMLVPEKGSIKEATAIRKEHFVIGKRKDQADLLLDLPVISRMHGIIEKKNGAYYLGDLHSTNGTYLNGVRLEENECRKLHNGDKIAFAREVYYFREMG
jgi:Sec-independent protein translocase protein TatA